jgi:hypothetical protein
LKGRKFLTKKISYREKSWILQPNSEKKTYPKNPKFENVPKIISEESSVEDSSAVSKTP